MEYKPTYLVMVTANNNNKYYRMIPHENTFDVEFGRVGANPQRSTYSISNWDKKYKEKIKKGYVDQSDLMEDLIQEVKSEKNKEYKDIEVESIRRLVEFLQDSANKTIKKHYKIGAGEVTQAMVDKAQDKINYINAHIDSYTVNSFNKDLIELFSIIPRKMSNVTNFLAKTTDEFIKIMPHEQDLLDVMKGQVVQISTQDNSNTEEDNSNPTETILDAMGLEFREVTNDEISHIKKLLGDSSNKFSKAWRVTNKKTQEKFDQFIKDENITELKELWHGSRNENWWSIINTGLVLRPVNAIITGKMFGIGTYFAPRARKSIGYTSLSGSYWASGNSSKAYMAVMEVAYGKPYNVYSFDSKFYGLNYNKLQQYCPGANCLHAHAGSMLRNDEIVIYREEQCTIKYLVEITN